MAWQRKIILLLTTLIPIQTLSANTVNTSLTAQVSVLNECTVMTNNLNFGYYDPIQANNNVPLDLVNTFTLQCSKGTQAIISLNNGMYGANAKNTSRAMFSGSHYLDYDIYIDGTFSQIWNQVKTVSYNSTSPTPTSITFYARIPARQNVQPGNYNDQLQINVAF